MKHEFALYVYGLSELVEALPPDGQLCIKSEQAHHRIGRVLRIAPDHPLVLFDQKVNALGTLNRLTKNDEVDVTLTQVQKNEQLKPTITVGLPLLKREALEQAIYGLVEVGASAIQLVTTEKSQQRWHGDKEFSRLQRIVIAAAEQSKNYAFPDVREPIALKDFIDVSKAQENRATIFFDGDGKHLEKVLNSFSKDITHFSLLIGPEADLSSSEKQALVDAGITFCALTPTILRARQAAVLGAGCFRAYF